MNSVRTKNAIIIALVAVIAISIIAGSVYVAVAEKSTYEEREYFFDEAPVRYDSNENFAYAKLFSETLSAYFNDVFSDGSAYMQAFAQRLLEAMAVSRISGKELGVLVSALNKYSLSEIFGGVKLNDFSLEELNKLYNLSVTEVGADFLKGFWAESGLTGEETGTIFYNYMNLYASEEYKKALHAVGKEPLVKMVADVLYFMTNVEDIEGVSGSYADIHVVKSALYELGTSLIGAAGGGIDNLERVLGLKWSFDEVENSAEINLYAAGTKNKICGLLPLVGCVLREIRAEDIGYSQLYGSTGSKEYAVLAQSGFAAAVKRGIDRFITLFGEEFGTADYDGFKAELVTAVRNLYCARFVAVGFDVEILKAGLKIADEGTEEDIAKDAIAEFFAGSSKTFERFFERIDELEAFDAEEWASLSDEDKESLFASADGLWEIKAEGTEIVTATAYMWAAQIFNNIQKEIE